MAFPLVNYATNELGKNPINEMIGGLMGGYREGSNLRYLQPTLAEALKKAQLENKYYGPNIESQIGLRGAQAGHYGALTAGQNIENRFKPQTLQSEIDYRKALIEQAIQNAALHKEQTQAAHLENEISPDYKRAQIAEANAKAEKLRMQQQYVQQLLGINYNNGMPQAQSNQMIPQGQGMFREPLEQNHSLQTSSMPSPQTNQGMSYAQASALMNILGEGKPHIVDVDGKQIAITPHGSFDTGVQGLSPGEKAFATNLGKQKGEFYQNSVNAYNSFNAQDAALDEMIKSVETNPEFRNVTGPINRPITYWFGTPEQQKLLGTLDTSSGEIALQVAPALKGAFTGRDQTLINSIKANSRDPADVFIGKLKAQKLIGNALKERSRLQAEYVEKGMSTLKASEKSIKETPLAKFEPQIKELTTHKKSLAEMSSSEREDFKKQAAAEYQRRLIAGKK